MRQGDFEDIALFRLNEEEEHIFRFVRSRGDDHHRSFSIIDFILKKAQVENELVVLSSSSLTYSTPWNRTTDIWLITDVFECDVIL